MITMLHHQRYDNDNIMKSRKLFMMARPRSQLHRGGGRKSCSRRQLVSPGELFFGIWESSSALPLCQILPIFQLSCVTDN